MSAEVLRRAAALMRERAEAAAESLHQSYDWHGIGTGYREPIKEHIASWDLVTALAVATMLDDAAWRFECDQRDFDDELERGATPTWSPRLNKAALAVARAYLGEAS